jgi:transposase-like protein
MSGNEEILRSRRLPQVAVAPSFSIPSIGLVSFSGESLRNVSRSLRLLGVQVSHQTVYNWIEKYTTVMEKYLDKITPQVSDTWATDELFLKVRGNMKSLYAMMDEQTRYWIPQEVAETKYTADVRPYSS